jgi:hypothetical protein
MSDVIEGFLVFASVLAVMVTLTAVIIYAAHRLDQWDDQKRDALAREHCVACQSDLPLICLTIARPPFDLCDSHYKRYRSISKLEYESDMWKRGQA